MAYGKLKVDTLTWDNSGSDTDVTISSLGAKADLNSPTFTGTVTAAALTVSGNLQVNGTTTTVASSTMTVTDKNIEIAKGAANDAAADGAGITVDSGDGDKTWNWVDSTNAWTSSEHIHLGDDKKLLVGTGEDFQVYHDQSNSRIHNTTGNLIFRTAGNFGYYNATGNETLAQFTVDGSCELYHNNSKKIETTTAGVTVTGAVTDSKGDVRSIPNVDKTSAYTLVASDMGKCIRITTGGVTVPQNVFNTNGGDAVTIINHSGSDQTITQGSGVTIYNAADASTGNRTLAGRGMATLYFASANTVYISGAGLS